MLEFVANWVQNRAFPMLKSLYRSRESLIEIIKVHFKCLKSIKIPCYHLLFEYLTSFNQSILRRFSSAEIMLSFNIRTTLRGGLDRPVVPWFLLSFAVITTVASMWPMAFTTSSNPVSSWPITNESVLYNQIIVTVLSTIALKDDNVIPIGDDRPTSSWLHITNAKPTILKMSTPFCREPATPHTRSVCVLLNKTTEPDIKFSCTVLRTTNLIVTCTRKESSDTFVNHVRDTSWFLSHFNSFQSLF